MLSTRLFRTMASSLKAGEVVVGDRDYSSYADIALFQNVGSHRIPDCPGRSEPCVRKRRPKNDRLMTQPRRPPAQKEIP